MTDATLLILVLVAATVVLRWMAKREFGDPNE